MSLNVTGDMDNSFSCPFRLEFQHETCEKNCLKCPICGGKVYKITGICTNCKTNVIEHNFQRISALIELYGNGVSMQAGLIIALSIGIFSIIPFILDLQAPPVQQSGFFVLLIIFEGVAYYFIHRYITYRKSQFANEFMIKHDKYLQCTNRDLYFYEDFYKYLQTIDKGFFKKFVMLFLGDNTIFITYTFCIFLLDGLIYWIIKK